MATPKCRRVPETGYPVHLTSESMALVLVIKVIDAEKWDALRSKEALPKK
jgi:hypothetical protein